MLDNNNKEENKRLLMKIVKAENSLVDLWLILDENKLAYSHLNVEEVISDIHKIRDKLTIAIGREICLEKTNVLKNEERI
nr:hypothetical protein [uncultured Mediterranean phage uvMED]